MADLFIEGYNFETGSFHQVGVFLRYIPVGTTFTRLHKEPGHVFKVTFRFGRSLPLDYPIKNDILYYPD
jgi:hypothetical protein